MKRDTHSAWAALQRHSALAIACVLAAAIFGAKQAEPANVALVATASTSFVSGHETITALNDGATPTN